MTSLAITSPKPAARAARKRLDWFQIGLLGLCGLLTIGALIYGGYLLTVFQLAMIYGIFCIGLNFFMGYTGQASFGQNAFACIGGYGSAILCVQYGWEPALALIASMVVAGKTRPGIWFPTPRPPGPHLPVAALPLGPLSHDISGPWARPSPGYIGSGRLPPL